MVDHGTPALIGRQTPNKKNVEDSLLARFRGGSRTCSFLSNPIHLPSPHLGRVLSIRRSPGERARRAVRFDASNRIPPRSACALGARHAPEASHLMLGVRVLRPVRPGRALELKA